MEPIVVAIDGPAGSGKGTVGKQVAPMLGLAYLDTGSLYRAGAYVVHLAGCDPDDGELCAEWIREAHIEVTGPGRVSIDGHDCSDVIRQEVVSKLVSPVSAHAAVRNEINIIVRHFARQHDGVVVEGRDTTTAVFPNATAKFFLTASVEARAQRRTAADGREVTVEELMKRDLRDSSREVAPLMEAPGSIYIDSTKLVIDDVIDIVFNKSKLAIHTYLASIEPAKPAHPEPWFAQ